MKYKVLCAPEPRRMDLIFSPENMQLLRETYDLIEVSADEVNRLDADVLGDVRYIIGQPPISETTLATLKNLRAIFNVESNLINNMPYDILFQRGIHVLTTGAVFALPVAEISLGFALDLARGISQNNADFASGTELWGGDGNTTARMLSGADVGIIGFGDLGRTLNRLLAGFRCNIRVFDPWVAPTTLREQGVQPADLSTVLEQSDFIFVMAAVTTENRHFLGCEEFAKMRQGANFILVSRADVVDFDAMMAAAASGRLNVATDVWPQEPLSNPHPARQNTRILKSAHRAGAMDHVFQQMGEMVLEDLDLLNRGLPPQRCKRAERETATKMQSKPVEIN